MDLSTCLPIEIGPEERVAFFSDAHLGGDDNEDSRRRTDKVCAFLASLSGRVNVLVVLGDLFDFYFEYRSVVPARYIRVLAALQEVVRSGIRCKYIAGNHDFWLGKLFTETLGVEVAPDGLLITRTGGPGCRVLAHHGDGLGEGDTGYKILKACLRNPALIRAFRLIHPDWGYAIANLTSRTSRKHTAGMQPARVEGSARTAESLLKDHPELDTVILAHTHQPDDRAFDSGRYLNTGDWCSHFSWVEWNEGKEFTLNFWKDDPE